MSIPLSQTSALVLVCDKKSSYTDSKSLEFLSQLDLSGGRKMYDKIKSLQPYLDEVIPNRKFFIHNFAKKSLKGFSRPGQALALACGWDPVLVKLSQEAPEHSFFGIDRAPVEDQEKLVKKIAPEAKIFYLSADAAKGEALCQKLEAAGWDFNKDSCLLVEGITYYIEPPAFWSSLSALKKRHKAALSICGDFLIDWRRQKISENSKRLALTIFEMIKEACAQDYFAYSSDQVKKHLEDIGFEDIVFESQDELQRQRTNSPAPWEKGEGHIMLFSAESPSAD